MYTLHALDADRLREQITKKLSPSRRIEEPVPHLVVHDFFDPSFYALLEEAWPSLDAFKRDKAGTKYDLVAASNPADPRSAGYDRLPADQRAVWDFFVGTVNRQIVAPLVARLFEPEIEARLREIRTAYDAGLIGYAMAGSRDWSYRANVGRLMIRANGHVLKPHVDSMPYLVTVLHYFSGDADEGFGTIFYKPERPLDFVACVRDGSTQYFDEAGIPCREVLRVPFRPNTLLVFPNTLTSAHGAVAPARGMRRMFQYHLSLKGDEEKV